jgi:DNA-binding response OmpR family regulator
MSLGGVTLRILIADDNPVFLKVLEAMLTNWGYEVVTACDGWEAWQILQGVDRPHLTILDWMMPGMTGLDVCRRVRSSSFGHLMYSLILTSKRDSADLTEAMEAGADDYVTKPFQSAELRTRLRIAAQILDLKQRVVSQQQQFQPMAIR